MAHNNDIENISSTEPSKDRILSDLYEAYEFFNLSYPTSEAAVNEAYYNKQRYIRENNPANQYSQIYRSKQLRDLLLENINTPLLFTNTEDDFEEFEEIPEQENSSIFIKQDNVVEDELVAWEDAISINSLKASDATKQKKKHHKKGRLFSKLLLLDLIILVAVTVYTIVMIKTGRYTTPEDSLIYSTLINEGLVATDDYSISITQDSLEDLEILQELISPRNQIALTGVQFKVKKNVATITAKSGLKFKKVDDEWVYNSQMSSIKIIEHNLVGTWEGPYKISKDSTTVSTISLTIEKKITDDTYLGVVTITAQNNKKGSYNASITVNSEERTASIVGTEWIEKPTFFLMEDLTCLIDIEGEEFLPVSDEGSLFELKKVK